MKIKEKCDCPPAVARDDATGYVPCNECPNRSASILTVGELRDMIRVSARDALAVRFPDLPPV